MENENINRKIRLFSLSLSSLSFNRQDRQDIAVLRAVLSSPDLFTPDQQEGFKGRLIALQAKQTEAHRLASCLHNLDHDLKSPFLPPFVPNRPKIAHFPDINNYRLISKQNALKDISLIQILKILFTTHKISKKKFKETIHRIKKGEKPQQSVLMLINAYLSTIKSTGGKITLKNLSLIENKRPAVSVCLKGQNYKVVLKRNYYFYRYYLKEADLSAHIQTEAEKRLIAYNKVYSPD